MLRTVAVVLALATLATNAVSQEDPIAKRQAIFKSFGQASRDPGAMLKGDQPFDLPKVQAALRTYQDGAQKLPDLFPEDSKTGHDTQALPAIWQDKTRFNAMMTKFGQDAGVALASIKDEASFKAEFPKVLRDCGGCHEAFRQKR